MRINFALQISIKTHEDLHQRTTNQSGDSEQSTSDINSALIMKKYFETPHFVIFWVCFENLSQ